MSPATALHLRRDDLGERADLHRIVLELTELTPIEDYPAVSRALAPLRAAGVRLAADDVGSGYAGFRHLMALDPDVIKLDISPVSGIEQSRSQRALASALVAFAADFGAVVIAEGSSRRPSWLCSATLASRGPRAITSAVRRRET